MTTNPLLFAQIREDARLETTLAREFDCRSVFCIASGGETAMALVAAGVERVHAVDFSPAQCAVTELKAIAAAELSYEEWLMLLGELPAPESWRSDCYQSLRALQSEGYSAAIDGHPSWIASGLNYGGLVEGFYREVAKSTLRLAPVSVWRQLFASGTALQSEVFYRLVDRRTWEALLEGALSVEAHLRHFPSAIFQNAAPESFGRHFARRFDTALRDLELGTNMYLHQLLFARWQSDIGGACPEFASPEGFAVLKRRLRSERRCLVIENVSMAQALGDAHARGERIDACFASNLFDWAPPEVAAGTAQALADALKTDAIYLHRNLFARPKRHPCLRSAFRFDDLRGDALQRLERTFLYDHVDVAFRV